MARRGHLPRPLLRLLQVIPVLALVSLGTFFLVELVPGDPAVAALGAEADEARLDQARTEMGLDQPLHERYVDWVGRTARGDLGNSLIHPSRSVTDLILQTLPITLQIAAMALLMALAIAVPLGVWAAYREGHGPDRATLALTSGLISVPTFLAGLGLAFLFVFNPGVIQAGLAAVGLAVAAGLGLRALRPHEDDRSEKTRPLPKLLLAGAILALTAGVVLGLPEFPRTGFSRLTDQAGLGENLRSAFLPALTLALAEAAVFTRLLRADLLATLQEDYIQAARAKGISPARVLWRHALRPSSFSLVTLAGVSLGRLIGGTVIVETVFGIPGMGRLIVTDGVIPGDIPIVQGGVLVIAFGYVLINLLVDASYAYLDPRARHD